MMSQGCIFMSVPKISFVIPCFNEEQNLKPLYNELKAVISQNSFTAEMIFTDDGSSDKSYEFLEQLAKSDSHVKVIKLRRNFGQTAAMAAGIDAARGEYIIPIDADRQNDPADAPRLLAKAEEGYEVVSGWRRYRKDPLSKKIPSRIANKLISWISGVKLHDYGCTLKVYHRDVIKDVPLYGEMHRFMPIHASWMGANVTELPVNHRPRVAGKSNYGLSRTFKVLLDLLLVKFLGTYSTKPIYFFGGFGLISIFLGFIFFTITLIQKFAADVWVHKNPMMVMGILFFIIGVQMIMLGILAELITRTYHESQKKPIYMVEKRLNQEEHQDKE